jgi:hypothetical protein
MITQPPYEVNTLAGRPNREVFAGNILIADCGCGPGLSLEDIEDNTKFIANACNIYKKSIDLCQLIVDRGHYDTCSKMLVSDFDCSCPFKQAEEILKGLIKNEI